jgi:hypothetical protein
MSLGTIRASRCTPRDQGGGGCWGAVSLISLRQSRIQYRRDGLNNEELRLSNRSELERIGVVESGGLSGTGMAQLCPGRGTRRAGI